MADETPPKSPAPSDQTPTPPASNLPAQPTPPAQPVDAAISERLAAISGQLTGLGAAVAASKEHQPRNRFRALIDRTGELAEHLFHVSIVFAVVALLAYVIVEAWNDKIAIDEFSLPKELAEAGYGPAVVADRIRADIRGITQAVRALPEQRDFRLASEDTTPDFEIPETKLPVKALVVTVRKLLGKTQVRIQGDIVKDENEYVVTIRVVDDPKTFLHHTRSFRVACTDTRLMIQRAAQTAMTFSDPFTIGRYLADRGDPYSVHELESIIQSSANCALPSHRAIAAVLYGMALGRGIIAPGAYPDAGAAYKAARALDQNSALIEVNASLELLSNSYDTADAIRLNLDALRSDSHLKTLGSAYVNLAQAYGQQAKFDDEIIYCQKAATAKHADPETQARALGYWAEALAAKGDLKAAQAKYNEAIQRYQLGAIYMSWGDFLTRTGDASGATSKYNQACTATVPAVEGCFLSAAELQRNSTGATDTLFSLCKRALQAKPSDSNVLVQIGAIEEHVHHDAHAEADYRAAMSLSPTDAKRQDSAKALYDLLMRLGRKREAAQLGAPSETL